jgi:hypothetical protein
VPFGAEDGAPCAARVYLAGTNGEAKFAPGAITYNKSMGEASERYFVPPTGAFQISLPWQVRSKRGARQRVSAGRRDRGYLVG